MSTSSKAKKITNGTLAVVMICESVLKNTIAEKLFLPKAVREKSLQATEVASKA